MLFFKVAGVQAEDDVEKNFLGNSCKVVNTLNHVEQEGGLRVVVVVPDVVFEALFIFGVLSHKFSVVSVLEEGQCVVVLADDGGSSLALVDHSDLSKVLSFL